MISLPSPSDLFTVSIGLLFQECQIVGIIWYVAFSDRLPSFSDLHLSFVYVFSWADSAHFFRALKNILLPECTKVYLSIHLLKDTSWLIPSFVNYK